MQDTQTFLSVAETLARRAGDLCLEIQQDLGEIHYKSKKDVVTRADIASEKLIVEGIRKAFPTHSIRTEEAGVIEGLQVFRQDTGMRGKGLPMHAPQETLQEGPDRGIRCCPQSR